MWWHAASRTVRGCVHHGAGSNVAVPVSVGKGIEALKTGGIGLLTVIGLPMLASIAAITIVGIPIALLGFALWLIGIYVAKIVTAVLFGRLFLEASNRHYAVMLLAGLVAVLVAINIPFVGGLLNFVLTILGLGILTEQIIRHLSRDRTAAPGASL